MSRHRKRNWGWLFRYGVVAITLIVHVVSTVGFPVRAASVAKVDRGPAFPCQDRPCGCATSEQCWSGDCCCATLEEKLAWADARGIEPPSHVRPLVAARQAQHAKVRSCCAHSHDRSEEETTHWVTTFWCQKCRGEATGLLKVDTLTPVGHDAECFGPIVIGSVICFPNQFTSIDDLPPIPPPRLG